MVNVDDRGSSPAGDVERGQPHREREHRVGALERIGDALVHRGEPRREHRAAATRELHRSVPDALELQALGTLEDVRKAGPAHLGEFQTGIDHVALERTVRHDRDVVSGRGQPHAQRDERLDVAPSPEGDRDNPHQTPPCPLPQIGNTVPED